MSDLPKNIYVHYANVCSIGILKVELNHIGFLQGHGYGRGHNILRWLGIM